MEPANRDIKITTGDTFRIGFRVYTRAQNSNTKTYIDLTGYTGVAKMRKHEADETVLLSFTVAVDPDQTTNRGLVRVTATAVQTAALTEGGVWACSLTSPGGEKYTWVRGTAFISPGVTR